MRLRAGKMRHYGTIQHFVKTGTGKGPRGQPLGHWLDLHVDVPMDVDSLGGKLLEIKRQLVPTATHQIWIRWTPGILASMRVRLFDQYFGIGFVDQTDFTQWAMGLVCTEIAEETTNG